MTEKGLNIPSLSKRGLLLSGSPSFGSVHHLHNTCPISPTDRAACSYQRQRASASARFRNEGVHAEILFQPQASPQNSFYHERNGKTMGVYIKGMKMPKNCMECFCINGEHLYCQAVGRKPNSEDVSERIPDWCPLVDVPAPHGKLIDTDKLCKHMTEAHKEWREHYELHKYVVPTWDDLIMVSCFPATIKADYDG